MQIRVISILIVCIDILGFFFSDLNVEKFELDYLF